MENFAEVWRPITRQPKEGQEVIVQCVWQNGSVGLKECQYLDGQYVFFKEDGRGYYLNAVLKWIPMPDETLMENERMCTNKDVPFEVVYAHLLNDYKEAKAKISGMQNWVEEARKRNKELKVENAELNGELSECKKELEDALKELERGSKVLKEYQEKLSVSDKALVDADAKNTEYRKKLAETRTKLDEAMAVEATSRRHKHDAEKLAKIKAILGM